MSGPGMGATIYPNQYERGMSDIEKIRAKNRSDKQQQVSQEPTTPKVHNLKSWDSKEIIKIFNNISNDLNKDNKDPLPYLGSNALNNDTSKTDEEPKKESKDSNASRRQMPIPDMQTDESSSDEKSSSGTKSSTPNVGNSAPKPTSGRTSPRRNTSRGEYADLENSGKTKAWYESLANSSYANDKAYEADMKAFRKMQADEIAKNGYYTDSQGVKVYAKTMTDKPKKESNNE